jgi:hypothetical protein
MHIFRHIFLSNYWWQKSDIWSQASYRYPISWEAFLDPSDSYFLFVDFVDFYTHLTYFWICIYFVAFFSATIDDRNLIFGHKLHIGIPYRGKRFWTHQIPTSCLPTLLIFLHIEHICSFFVTFFSATIDGWNLIFGQKLHIGTPYRGKRFLTRQDSYFLLAKEWGYHRWALAHSSSCLTYHHRIFWLVEKWPAFPMMLVPTPFNIFIENCTFIRGKKIRPSTLFRSC